MFKRLAAVLAAAAFAVAVLAAPASAVTHDMTPKPVTHDM